MLATRQQPGLTVSPLSRSPSRYTPKQRRPRRSRGSARKPPSPQIEDGATSRHGDMPVGRFSACFHLLASSRALPSSAAEAAISQPRSRSMSWIKRATAPSPATTKAFSPERSAMSTRATQRSTIQIRYRILLRGQSMRLVALTRNCPLPYGALLDSVIARTRRIQLRKVSLCPTIENRQSGVQRRSTHMNSLNASGIRSGNQVVAAPQE
jgi:hypothetical protein